MIRLLGDKIAVKPIGDPDTSEGKPNYTASEIAFLIKEHGQEYVDNMLSRKGSLIVPDEAKERSDQGIVMYVGPKVRELRVGDYILFSGYTGTNVQFSKDAEGVLIIFREKFATLVLDVPDTDVKGLYFRSQREPGALEGRIRHRLKSLNKLTEGELEALTNDITIYALEDEPYFTATYEMAMNLIAQSFKGSDFAKRTGFKDPLSARMLDKGEVEFEDEDDYPELTDDDKDLNAEMEKMPSL